MRQDATLQVGVKFVPDVAGQAFGGGIGVDSGQKGFEMIGHHLVEHRGARIARCVGGRRHDGAL